MPCVQVQFFWLLAYCPARQLVISSQSFEVSQVAVNLLDNGVQVELTHELQGKQLSSVVQNSPAGFVQPKPDGLPDDWQTWQTHPQHWVEPGLTLLIHRLNVPQFHPCP